MAERAAHLVDHVLPDAPVRQWVLSVPYRLRYLLAWDHELCRAVVGVYVRAVVGFLRARARRNNVADGRSGAVAIIQRFGGALNLNVHIHALVIDGVFAHDGEGLRFRPAHRLTRDEVSEVVAVVAQRIDRLLWRRGVATTGKESEAADIRADGAPVLAGLPAASVQGLTALGPCHANADGFDLHAGIVVQASGGDVMNEGISIQDNDVVVTKVVNQFWVWQQIGESRKRLDGPSADRAEGSHARRN